MRRFYFLSTLVMWLTPLARADSSGVSLPDNVVSTTNVMVAMRDGVHLATDIYLPAREGTAVAGTYPTLITRTPYGKEGLAAQATFFAGHGYVVVVQDVRGRYDSEGIFYIYLNEARDGYDTVEWAAGQPWSNGAIGTYGRSYGAGAENALASERPRHLKSMLVMVGSSNYHEDGAARGGATYLLHNIAYEFFLASTGQEAARDPAVKVKLEEGLNKRLGRWIKDYPYLPEQSPFRVVPSYDLWFHDWLDHPDYDDYWKQNGYTFDRYFDQYPDIPIFLVGGWYDIFLRGTLTSYSALSKLHHAPTRLLIGPWVHGLGARLAGEVDFGEAAAIQLDNEIVRWFDATLRKKNNGLLAEKPVRLFTMGGGSGGRDLDGHLEHGGRWQSFDCWPAPNSRSRTFYLAENGVLSETLPGGDQSPTAYTFDPSHPVPTIGGQIDSGKTLSPDGAFDQRCRSNIFGCTNDLPLSSRSDVRVFQTAPLAQDLEVTGRISVKIFVSSDARDTDFTAKLIDAYPPSKGYPAGYAMNIADRIVRLRYSQGTGAPILLRPGEIREVTIDLLGTSNVFAKGHRIRLDVSSSNFPFFDVNPNTGESLVRPSRMIAAKNTIFHDRTHPSRVLLPVTP